MKQLFFFIMAVLSCSSAYAQGDGVLVWNKWCARKDTMVLFDGGNNVIQVYCPGIKPADIKIKSLDRGMRIGLPEIKGDTLTVMAMPFPDKGKNMRLAIQNKKTSKTISTVSFVSDSIPQPIARVGSIQAGEAARKDILAQTTLKVSFPHSLYSYPYAISQYSFRIVSDKGVTAGRVKGFFLNTEVLQAINTAPAGATIEFTEIKATCPDCTPRAVQDIKLKIR